MANNGIVDWKAAAIALAEALATTDATPGGGSAAGAAAAMGCALTEMAAGISAGSKKIDDTRRKELKDTCADFRARRSEFERLTSEDAAAFDAVMAALKLPKETPGRKDKIQATLKKAGEVPLETARAAVAALERLGSARGLAVGTVASDMNCAEHMLRAAALCALENVDVNVNSIKDSAIAGELGSEAALIRKRL